MYCIQYMQYMQYLLIHTNTFNTHFTCITSNTYPDVAGELLQVNCMPIHTILIDTENTGNTYHSFNTYNTYQD
jgi:hypothetical protein